MTHIFAPDPSSNVTARVSPVALGILVMDEILSAAGSYLKEFVLSCITPPENVLPPPVKIKPLTLVVGMKPSGTGSTTPLCTQTLVVGVNSQI